MSRIYRNGRPQLAYVALTLLVAGCQVGVERAAEATETAVQASATPKPPFEESSTQSPTVVISTATLSESSHSDCSASTGLLDVSVDFTGSVILLDSDDTFLNRLYRLNLASGEVSPLWDTLPRGYVETPLVSPDNSKLAFALEADSHGQATGRRLIVGSVDSDTYYEYPLDGVAVGATLSSWLEDNVRLVAFPPVNKSLLPGIRPDKAILMDTKASAFRVITPAFPYGSEDLWEYWDVLGSSVTYDATLTRALYLDDSTTWVLYDLVGAKELWRSFLFGVPHPSWAIDGSGFVFPVFLNGPGGSRDPAKESDEIGFVRVTRDGTEHRTRSIASVSTSITSYGASPRGRYIWFRVQDGTLPPGLYLWDFQKEQLVSCFREALSNPVWSISDQYFAVLMPTEARSVVWTVDSDSLAHWQSQAVDGVPIAWLSQSK